MRVKLTGEPRVLTSTDHGNDDQPEFVPAGLNEIQDQRDMPRLLTKVDDKHLSLGRGALRCAHISLHPISARHARSMLPADNTPLTITRIRTSFLGDR
jgi:hypothetical protein